MYSVAKPNCGLSEKRRKIRYVVTLIISALYNNGCDFGINGGKKPDTQLDDKVPPINAGIFLSLYLRWGIRKFANSHFLRIVNWIRKFAFNTTIYTFNLQICKFAFFANWELNSQICKLDLRIPHRSFVFPHSEKVTLQTKQSQERFGKKIGFGGWLQFRS